MNETTSVLLRPEASEPVRSEVLIGSASTEYVERGDEDGMAHGLSCLGRAASPAKPCVLGPQISVLGASGRFRRFGQAALEPLRTGPSFARPLLAGRLVMARTHSRPRGETLRAAKARHVDTDLGD